MVKIKSGRSGRTIVRFNAFERFVHWMTATCFIILAISGLNITFGRSLLLPLMSPEAFTTWSEMGKYAHNYLSFPFTLGVVLIFLMWIGGNIPNKVDAEWLKRGGGIVGHDHPPAYRFNAGQKMVYWIVVLGGGAVAVTGYLLMFPFYGTDIGSMQTAQIVHAVVGVLFVAAMLAHIYIGTIGMEGAFEAMGEGTVDVNWAKEHHSLWLEEERARTGPNQSQRQTMATPAEYGRLTGNRKRPAPKPGDFLFLEFRACFVIGVLGALLDAFEHDAADHGEQDRGDASGKERFHRCLHPTFKR
jgi:formate dehydrogenase subunit gamma